MKGRALPPARLLVIVAPVSTLGVAAFVAATLAFVRHPGSVTTVVGVGVFLVASTLSERFPVPVEGADANGVSLGFVFATAALVLFGWAPATFVYVTAPTLVAILWRTRPGIRTLYNAGVFGIVGAIAGAALASIGHGNDAEAILARVTLTSAILYAVNILLVTAAISASGSALGYVALIRSNVRGTILPFTLMASTALMLVVLWQRTPFLFAALAGPLAAISLYQRSTLRALRAMRLALTDPLTGLGNHRHFHEQLARSISVAAVDGQVSLCLLDIDDFKQINDRFGHPAGDRILALVAARMRAGGEAFRVGGDEFAVILPGAGAEAALTIARSIVARIAEAELGTVETISVSAGVSTYPAHGRHRDSLIRLADAALLTAKELGKNRVVVAESEAEPLADDEPLQTTGPVTAPDPPASATGVEWAARLRAADALVREIDARDAYTGSHSERVASLAVEIAEQLDLAPGDVELIRLAARLHDLGKLAIPQEILHKPGALSEAERLVLERHPQIGHEMLVSLGLERHRVHGRAVDHVAESVLHHHERWGGDGYPAGLEGEEIPLGARVIFVADAFDAMTSERPYRLARTRADALREIGRCAGTQFDPEVVGAFLTVASAREAVGV